MKYFAYQNGHKYTKKGEQTIIIGKEKFGGEKSSPLTLTYKKSFSIKLYAKEMAGYLYLQL